MTMERPFSQRWPDAALFLHSADEELLAFATRAACLDPDEVSQARFAWVVGGGSRKPPALRPLVRAWPELRDAVAAHWRARRDRPCSLSAPDVASPELLRGLVLSSGMYPDEAAAVLPCVTTPYEALTTDDVQTALHHDLFLPDIVFEYLAPALADRAAALAADGDDELDRLVAALARTTAAGQIDTAGLVRAVQWRPPRVWNWGLASPDDPNANAWASLCCEGPAYGRLLVLLADLAPSSAVVNEIFAADSRTLALSVVEHDRAAAQLGWRPRNPAAVDLYADSAILERLIRLSTCDNPFIARLADEALGGSRS